MIILFDKDYSVENTYGQENNTLGIGVLRDAISCTVTEELNGTFELEMEYPIVGSHYKDIDTEKVLLVEPNDTMESQPFRIYKITRPIDGVVTIYARHISYDASAIPIRAINATDLDDLAAKINNSNYQLIRSPFVFELSADKQGSSTTTFVTLIPYSLRTLLLGDDKSVLNVYEGDFTFDRNKIILSERRGENRDFVIRYSKNMTDLEYESSSEIVYDGVCPYYNSKVTETKTKLGSVYKAIYLSSSHEEAETNKVINPEAGPDQYLYPKEWLAYNDNGSALSTIVTFTVVNMIESNNENFYGELIRGKKLKIEGVENEYWYEIVTYKKAYIDKTAPDEFGDRWLCSDADLTTIITPQEWNPNNLPIGKEEGNWNPDMHRDIIYRIYTEGANQYTVYIWKYNSEKNKYMYMEATKEDGVDLCKPTMPNVGTYTEEKDNTILYEGDVIYVNEKRARINENAVPNSASWLIEVEEEIQSSKDDPRWKDVDEQHTPIDPTLAENSGINYKVPIKEIIKGTESDPKGEIETIEGKTESDKDLLRYVNNQEPIDPENNQCYYVVSGNPKTKGQHFYLRWNDFNKKFDYMKDTRYTYTNYVWNGEQYVERNNSHDKILTVDLTDKFNDQPSDIARFQKQLYDESISYVKANKIGQIKDSIKVSFIKLSSSPEYSKWRNLEKVSLGDTVTIIYEDLGINAQKKVIKTEYNVLTGSYDNIELGEKLNKFTDNAIVTGDNVSALTNNRNFADKLTASNIAAKAVEADYIKAATADLTEANIDNLTATEISATLITAQTFAIDELVAQLLVADNALIKGKLTSGELEINGNININSGSIAIVDDSKVDYVDAYINPHPEEGSYGGDWLYSDIELTKQITPGSTEYPINTIYKVYEASGIWTGQYYKWIQEQSGDKYQAYSPEEIKTSFKVDERGNVAIDSGKISIKFHPDEAYINTGAEQYSAQWLAKDANLTNIYVPDPLAYYLIKSSGDFYNKKFQWDENQEQYIEFTGILPDSAFLVDERGNVTANSLNISKGIITTEAGSLNGIEMINAQSINAGEININDGDLQIKNVILEDTSEANPFTNYVTLAASASIADNETKDTSGNYINKIEVKITASLETGATFPINVSKPMITNTNVLELEDFLNYYLSGIIHYEFENGEPDPEANNSFSMLLDLQKNTIFDKRGDCYFYYYITNKNRINEVTVATPLYNKHRLYSIEYNKVTSPELTIRSDISFNNKNIYDINYIGNGNSKVQRIFCSRIDCDRLYSNGYPVHGTYGGVFTAQEVDTDDAHDGWYWIGIADIIPGTSRSADEILQAVIVNQYEPGDKKETVNISVWWGTEGVSGKRHNGIFIYTDDSSNNTFSIIAITKNN